ncbi:MAG: dihydrolipoyl dehydrogenase [Acidobacteriota bacterium]
MAERYDLIVIGGGPGGYVAAVHAARLGLKAVCVEKEPRLGGVCLNVGCIPSKALLDSSELYHAARDKMAAHGIRIEGASVDLDVMMDRKRRVVEELSEGVRRLVEGSGVLAIRGTARLAGADEVEVTDASGGRTTLRANAVLLATGSEPASVPGLPFDGVRVVSSTEALSFESVPEHLGIVGGGYIGLELGSVWRRLGSRVTVIEMTPRIAATLDAQVGRTLERSLAGQGIEFRTKTKVASAEASEDGVKLTLETEGKRDELFCDKLLVAVGRRPLTQGLGFDEVGVAVDSHTGRIPVDIRYRTNVPSIYAIGDLIAGPMLAHKASAEGIAAVECMAGIEGEVNYDAIPAIVYTSPEVASVGLTEEQAKERSIDYCIGSFPFSGSGRAKAMGETEGFVKLITHARTDRLIGAHIIGPRASDLIGECVLAVEFCATTEDILRSVHGHPTFSESIHEAAMAVRRCSKAKR